MDDAARPRPAQICDHLVAALDASEGRRRRRKRNTAPDRIGLAVKRGLLEAAVREDPAPAEFEAWLAQRCSHGGGDGAGAVWAMALEILDEWRMAAASPSFRTWLERGAPSDDAV